MVRDGIAGGPPPPGAGGTALGLRVAGVPLLVPAERERAGGFGGELMLDLTLAFPVFVADIGCVLVMLPPFSNPGLDSKYLEKSLLITVRMARVMHAMLPCCVTLDLLV